MNREEETAQRGNAGGKVNHQRWQSTTAAARPASPGRDYRRGWRPVRIGEIIERAMARIGMEVRCG